MIKLTTNHNAFSTIEYMVLITVILLSLFVFKDYVLRAFQGRMYATGEQYSFARQWDPQRSVDCQCDTIPLECNGDASCIDQCPTDNSGQSLVPCTYHEQFCYDAACVDAYNCGAVHCTGNAGNTGQNCRNASLLPNLTPKQCWIEAKKRCQAQMRDAGDPICEQFQAAQ